MRIIIGDEAQRLEAGGFHSLGQQHAERLVRVPAFEAVDAPCSAACRAGRSRPAVRRVGAGSNGAAAPPAIRAHRRGSDASRGRWPGIRVPAPRGGSTCSSAARHRSTSRALPDDARTVTSSSLNRITSKLSPAKKMWSPITKVDPKPSSTLPSLRPLAKRISIIGLSTITPALSRCCAATCGRVIRQRPGSYSTSRRNLS